MNQSKGTPELSQGQFSVAGGSQMRNDEVTNVFAFEKNYPKNIFIPIIQFLAEMGFKQYYQQTVGSREKFQSKNVVSLNTLYQLISQPWLSDNINKQNMVQNICNKILLNSKIKKKIFHIKMANKIINTEASNSHEFRTLVSKESYRISSMNRRNQLHDQLFNYPNTCIYLLHLFLQTLADQISLKSLIRLYKTDKNKEGIDFEGLAASTDSIRDQYKQYCFKETMTWREKGSKQEYKFLTKEIVSIFSKKGITFDNHQDSFQFCSQVINQRMIEIRQKYSLDENVPNWTQFTDSIIENCFKRKRNQMKVTNSIFNDWVTEFKSKCVSVAISDQSQKQPMNLADFLLEENFSKMKISPIIHSEKWYGAKQFTPIIISKINFQEIERPHDQQPTNK